MEHLEQDCARMDAENEAIRRAKVRSMEAAARAMAKAEAKYAAYYAPEQRAARLNRELDLGGDEDDDSNEDIMAGLQEEQNDNG